MDAQDVAAEVGEILENSPQARDKRFGFQIASVETDDDKVRLAIRERNGVYLRHLTLQVQRKSTRRGRRRARARSS